MTGLHARFFHTALATYAVGCFLEVGIRLYPLAMRSLGSKLHESTSLVAAAAWVSLGMLMGAVVRLAGIGIAFRVPSPPPGKRNLAIALLGELIFGASIAITLWRMIKERAIPADSPALLYGELAMALSLVGCVFFTRQVKAAFAHAGMVLPASRGLTTTMPIILASACVVQAVLAHSPLVGLIAGSGDGAMGKAAKIAALITFIVGLLFASWARLIWLFLLGKWMWGCSKKAREIRGDNF